MYCIAVGLYVDIGLVDRIVVVVTGDVLVVVLGEVDCVVGIVVVVVVDGVVVVVDKLLEVAG